MFAETDVTVEKLWLYLKKEEKMGNFVLKRDLEQHDEPIQAQSSSVKFKDLDISLHEYGTMLKGCLQIEQIH